MADAALFGAGGTGPLPAGVERPASVSDLTRKRWELLALTTEGCRRLARTPQAVCACGTALLPSGWSGLAVRQIRAERVVSCGLSPRDSLTFSSLDGGRTVVCVQRALSRPDGGTVEPQELPAGRPDGPPEDLLAAVGLGLLL